VPVIQENGKISVLKGKKINLDFANSNIDIQKGKLLETTLSQTTYSKPNEVQPFSECIFYIFL